MKQDKIYLIAGIAVVLVLALVLTVPQVLVGEAITVGDTTLDIDSDLVLSISTLTSALSFKMTLKDSATDDFLACEVLQFDSLQEWEYVESSCEDNIYSFGMATLGGAASGAMLQITSEEAIPDDFVIGFSEIDVYVGGEDIFVGESDAGEFLFIEPEVAVVESSGSGSGGGSSGSSLGSGPRGSSARVVPEQGASLSCEREWECGDWSDCSNYLQTRTCLDRNKCKSTETSGGKEYPVVVLGDEKPSESQACVAPQVQVQEPVVVKKEGKVKTFVKEHKALSGGALLLIVVLMGVGAALIVRSRDSVAGNKS